VKNVRIQIPYERIVEPAAELPSLLGPEDVHQQHRQPDADPAHGRGIRGREQKPVESPSQAG
jgi:hypothetical protein